MTGKNDKRPQFQKMIADSRKRLFEGVLVYRLDRLSRNSFDAAIYKKELEKNGVRIISATENLTDTPEGRMLEGFLVHINQFYSEELAQKVNRGLDESFHKGYYMKKIPPFGYKLIDRKLFPDEVTAPLAAEIFERYNSGQRIVDIVKWLNSMGMTNQVGNAWKPMNVSTHLRNRTYKGEYYYGQFEEPMPCPALVTAELFDAVQERLRASANRPRKRTDYHFMLTGKLICAECGHSVSGSTSHTKTHYYYCRHCKKEVRRCVNADLLHEKVQEALRNYLTMEKIEELAEAVYTAYLNEQPKDTRPALQQELKAVEKQLQNAVTAVLNGFASEALKTTMQELEDRRRALLTALEEMPVPVPQLTRAHFAALLRHIVQHSETELLDTIVNHIILRKDDTVIICINLTDENNLPPLEQVLFSVSQGDSTITVNALKDMYVGNIVAQASGDLSLSSVKVCNDTDISEYATISNDGDGSCFGGLVGNLTSAGTVSITGCEYQGEIKGGATKSRIGGLIGCVSNSDTFDITISDATKVSGKIMAVSGNTVGGTIGEITTSSSDSSGRVLTLNGLSVSGLVMDVSGTSGGFLGQNWYKTDVEFTNFKVGSGAKLTSTGDTAGLVHTATGYWKVNESGITLGSSASDDTMSVTAGSADSFGLLVNKGFASDSAIYLELAPSAYAVNKEKVSLVMGSVKTFDEIVAYTGGGNNVLENGQGIISIATANHALLKMGSNGTGTTYQHQTAFLDSNNNLINNPHSRYYYNLDAYRISPSDSAQQLLIWSVKQYAHKSIQSYFKFSEGSITESMDMAGYSYYPVDLTGRLTLNGAVHLYNTEFDAAEASTTDNRLTNESAQHSLMQNSLFRNVSGALTFAGSLNGNINKIDSYCGALAMGTVSSDASGSPATINVNSLELDGIKIGSAAGPLLINKAGSNATLNITNVSNDGISYQAMGIGAGAVKNDETGEYTYSPTYIATSLLGAIGSADATAVKLNFSLIKLDGRNASGVTALPDLDSVYHSKGSLFSKATLVDTFAYKSNSGSYGVYNYEYDKDWNDGNGTASRNVTYGAEIDSTIENVDDQGNSKQQKYNRMSETDTVYYTRSDVDPVSSNTVYNSFSDYFQKYVSTPYTDGGTNHELRVNISTSSFRGCGTYNDPYIITSGGDLENIAKLINGSFTTSSFPICVPSAVNDTNKSATWCANKDTTSHTEYTTFKLTSGNRDTSTWSTSDGKTIKDSTLAEYLAGAYYKIDNGVTGNITLTSEFEGISNSNITNDAYAFRGVIDGSGKTIVNTTTYPLIVNSYGSVIYNLTLDVQPTESKKLSQTSANAFSLNGGCESYGAVMGKIFGGDNIIDNVSVKFTGTVIDAHLIKVSANDRTEVAAATKAHLVPIGGYVGVVINGGLIFREMTGLAKDDQAGLKSANLSGFSGGVGKTPDDPTASDNTKWLYVNPIVGRVLNGYAVTESDTYKPFEDGTRTYPDGTIEYWHGTYADKNSSGKIGITMRNGTKNYSIADISTDIENFTMESVADGKTITIPNAQSLYIISLITECGLGKSTTGKYNNNGATMKPYNSNMATHLAHYTYVGDSSLTGSAPTLENATTVAQIDYASTIGDKYADSSDKVPYIIKQYTPSYVVNGETLYSGFGVTGTSANYHYIVLSDDENSDETFYIPDGYRGLGALLFGDTVKATNEHTMFLYGFNGNSHIISLNMTLNNYPANTSHNTSGNENYTTSWFDQAYFKTGFGFINCLMSKYENNNPDRKFKDLTIRGSVKQELIDPSTGKHTDYSSSYVGNDYKANPAVAAFVAAPIEGSGSIYFENIELDSMDISGMRHTGGFVGAINVQAKYYFMGCSADNLKIFGGVSAGGLVGYCRNMKSEIEADFEDKSFGLISVVSAYTTAFAPGDNSYVAAGGLIGDNESQVSDADKGIKIRNARIVNGSSVSTGYIGYYEDGLTENSKHNPTIPATGGVIGYVGRASRINLDHVTVENLNVSGARSGGMIGSVAAVNSPITSTNCIVTTDQNCTIESYGDDAGSGGVIGYSAVNNATAHTRISNLKIENYKISGAYNCGGLIGKNTSVNGQQAICNNIESDGITLSMDNQGGGLIGDLYNGELVGYNILINNQSSEAFTEGGTITNNGYIIGRNNSRNVKIAGFSRQGTIDTAKMVGDKEVNANGRYGSDGYVIFADYTGSATDSAKRSTVFSPFNAGEVRNNQGFGNNQSTISGGNIINSDADQLVGYRFTTVKTTTSIKGETSKVETTYDMEQLDEPVENKYLVVRTNITDNTPRGNSYSKVIETYTEQNENYSNAYRYVRRYTKKTYTAAGAETINNDNEIKTNTNTTQIQDVPRQVYYTKETINYNAPKNGDVSSVVTETTIVEMNCNDNWPYVTSSPKTNITASQFLTGDGVSFTSYYGSAAQAIVQGINTNKGYANTGLSDTEKTALRTRLASNMSTIKSVVTSTDAYNGEDFPVLVIDDLSTADDLVNNYLKLLTNTNYDFYDGYSSGSTYIGKDKVVYNVDISKWKFNSTTGKFEKQSGEASLKCEVNDRFYITPTEVDNEKWQFSLIDVQFYDPTNTPTINNSTGAMTKAGSIAYHLYVPVIVKKMLHYTVQIRPASTTSYTLSAYPQSIANLVENLGNPITMKVTYTYQQTAQNWTDAINGGESVYRNYTKILDVKSWGDLMPEDAIAILVDPNNNADKYYTGSFSSILTAGEVIDTGTKTYKLNLNSFSGFNISNFNDLMTISLNTDAETKNLVEWEDGTDPEGDLVAVINDGGDDDGKKLRYKKTGETGQYAVSVALKNHQNDGEYVQEHYYISIFTKENISESDIYHYEVKSTGTNFGDSSYPSARVGTLESPHLFLGNIYTNTVKISETNENQLMSESNLNLSANLTATVGFTPNAVDNSIASYLSNENVKIYQTFMVALNRLNGEAANQRGILVDPTVVIPTGYKINGATPDEDYEIGYHISPSYIELTNECNIKEKLQYAANHPKTETVDGVTKKDYTISITESMSITYAFSSLSTQFPQATAATSVDTRNSNVGTYMIGYSNISSTSTGGAASRASVNTDGSDRLCYYIDDDTSVDFSYNAVYNSEFGDDGNGNYGQLGLDGKELDENDESYVQIKSAARYNTSDYNLKASGKYVKITVKLAKKGDTNGAYTTALNIPTYLTDFEILDKNGHAFVQTADDPATEDVDESIIVITNSADNIYTYILPKDMLNSLSPDEFYIPINFKAYSGNNSTFEGKNSNDMQYSNYKVLVTAGLLTSSTSESVLPNSDGQDHIIYTNAKIHSEIID